MNDGFMRLYEKYSDVEFLVLTNGSLLDDARCEKLVQLGNVFPLLFLEGDLNQVSQVTDPSVYQMVMQALDRMKARGLLFGVITPTKLSNLQQVVNDEFILPLIRKGARVHAYVTSTHGKEEEQLNASQVSWLEQNLGFIRQNRPYMAVHLTSHNPFVCRCVVGPLSYHFGLGEINQMYQFPQLSVKNSAGQRLVNVLKSIRY